MELLDFPIFITAGENTRIDNIIHIALALFIMAQKITPATETPRKIAGMVVPVPFAEGEFTLDPDNYIHNTTIYTDSTKPSLSYGRIKEWE